MTYDYHGWFEGDFPWTGHNSPLYSTPEEEEEEDLYTLNTDWSVDYWLQGGADPTKILLGVATYGRGFTLLDASDHGLYANATGPNPAGPYTQTAGFWGYNEYCEMDGFTVVRVSE